MTMFEKRQQKARENRVRRAAERWGYGIRKDRARIWSYSRQQEYMLVQSDTSGLVMGANFDASLDDIEAFLRDEEATARAEVASTRGGTVSPVGDEN